MLDIFKKNNLAIICSFLLIIFLSQTNFMEFFFGNLFGACLLIIFIFYVGYNNKLVGVVCALIALIVFSCFYNYQETFQTSQTSKMPQNKVSNTNFEMLNDEIITEESEDTENIDPVPEINYSTINNDKYENQEGFDIIGKESSLLKGKRSNVLPLNKLNKSKGNAIPFEGNNLYSNY